MIQTIRQECPNHFLIFGQQHFDQLISEYVDDYHAERPHQSPDNKPLVGPSLTNGNAFTKRLKTQIGRPIPTEFGSDWPVTRMTDDFASVVNLTRSDFDSKGTRASEKLFSRNAVRFYGIQDP